VDLLSLRANTNYGLLLMNAQPLRNGCHDCANAGQVAFSWNFDPKRKFLRTSLQGQGMLDPPLG